MDRQDEHRAEETEMPIGFAMALSRDPAAMYAFGRMDVFTQDRLLSQARMAKSRQQMQKLVADIGGTARTIQPEIEQPAITPNGGFMTDEAPPEIRADGTTML